MDQYQALLHTIIAHLPSGADYHYEDQEQPYWIAVQHDTFTNLAWLYFDSGHCWMQVFAAEKHRVEFDNPNSIQRAADLLMQPIKRKQLIDGIRADLQKPLDPEVQAILAEQMAKD